MLRCLAAPKAKGDFLSGENGAVKLTKEQLNNLEEFSRVVRPSRRQHETNEDYVKAVNAAAEHLVCVVESKGKKVLEKTTYKDLKSSLDAIKSCGYFERKQAAEEKNGVANEDAADGVTGSKMKEDKKASKSEKKPRNNRKDKNQEQEKAEETPTQHYQAQVVAHHTTKEMVTPPEAPVANGMAHQQPCRPPTTASATQQQFSFLQDSQIDMESPHMDPAVVVVHNQAPPPPTQVLGSHHLPAGLPVTTASQVPSTVHQHIMAQVIYFVF